MSENTTNRKFKKSDIAVIKWLFTIGKKQIWRLAVIILVNVIWASLSVVFANFSKNIIDGAVEYHDVHYVIRYAIALFCIIMLQLALNLISNSMSERCRGRLDIDYRRYLLKEIMKKDYSKITAYHTGELQNRLFNDITVITEGVTTIIPNTAFYIVKLVCAFIYLVIISRIFALVFLAGGIFVLVCMRIFRKPLKRLHKNVQETEGATRSFFQESIINLLVVKSFSAEKRISEEADILQEKNYKARMKRRFMRILSNAGVSSVFNIGYVFALTYGALCLLGIGGMSITYGTVTAMLQLVNQVQGPFASLSAIFPMYYTVIASAERLMEITNLPDEKENNEEDIDVKSTYDKLESIEFSDITFKYDRDVILDDTSLTVNKGDFIAITGISGIGKSTLLKLLIGVLNVEKGSIVLKLKDGEIAVDKHTRRLFSYVPQGNMLLSGSIRDNLTFIHTDVTDEEIENAIKISCADKFIRELPQGIDTVIGEKGLGLSEGQVQRLAIARSMLSDSPVLLLDEATSALDEETEKEFLMNLKKMKNVTCIIVSHKKAALEICNKHVRIENSKIISEVNDDAAD